MKIQTLCCFLLFAVAPLAAQLHSRQALVASVHEPPELTGKPKEVKQLTDDQKQLFEIVTETGDKDKEKVSAGLPRLSAFIEQHPNYSDAYIVRATLLHCTLETRDYSSVLKDIDAAISTYQGAKGYSIYENLRDHYSLRGKVKLAMGQHREAIDDLEAAMREDISSADQAFNVTGVEPENTSGPCTWSLGDLNLLAAKFPNDYRLTLLRGAYFKFFTTFKSADIVLHRLARTLSRSEWPW